MTSILIFYPFYKNLNKFSRFYELLLTDFVKTIKVSSLINRCHIVVILYFFGLGLIR